MFCANCAKINSAKPSKTHRVSCAKVRKKNSRENFAKKYCHFVETLINAEKYLI